MRTIINSLIAVFFLSGCNTNSNSWHGWTDEQRKEFKIKCSQTKTFNSLVFSLRGFDDNEFDSILVKEFNGNQLLRSFNVYIFPAQSPQQKDRKERWGTINQILNINYTYRFIIPGKNLCWDLTDMKMIMRAHYTNNSEGWGCDMYDYTINGHRFPDSGNPTFYK
jgi:hypothetical protein